MRFLHGTTCWCLDLYQNGGQTKTSNLSNLKLLLLTLSQRNSASIDKPTNNISATGYNSTR